MCEYPLAVTLYKLERELQVPGMTATSEDSCIHMAMTYESGTVTIDLNIHLLMLCRIIVQRSVGNSLDISLLWLAHTRHVSQHKLIGMNAIQRCCVLGNHCLVHFSV